MFRIFGNRMSIAVKLPIFMASMVAIAVIIVSARDYLVTRDAIHDQGAAKLTSVGRQYADQIDGLLEAIDHGLITQSRDETVASAIIEFSSAYREMFNPSLTLHRDYIDDNPNPLGEKNKFLSAGSGSSYDVAHEQFHPLFNTLKDAMGYYDVFLFNLEGDLVYSVFKEQDFATNLITGEWRESGLADVFRGARANGIDDPSHFEDFAPYEPSYGAPAAFIARPVFAANGEAVGVLAYQMPIDALTAAAVGEGAGLGDSGDAFLVGSDGYLRTDSLRTKQSDVLETQIDTLALRQGNEGNTGIFDYQNSGGEPVLGYVVPIRFQGVHWIMVVEQTTSELYASLRVMLWNQIVEGLIFLVLALGVAIMLSRSLGQPLKRVNDAVKRVSDRDFETEVPATERFDEIGEIARALDDFRMSFAKAESLARDAAFRSAAFHATGGPMLLTDIDLNVVGANAAFVRLANEDKQDGEVVDESQIAELIGTQLANLDVLPLDLRNSVVEYTDLLAKGIAEDEEPDAGLLIDAVHDGEGQPIGYVLDLKNQSHLMASEVLLRALDRQQARLEMDVDGTIQAVNERFAAVLGGEVDDLIGTNGRDLIHLEDKSEVDNIWEAAMAGEGSIGQFRVTNEAGNRILDGSFNPVPNQEWKTTGFLIIGVDVTEAQFERAEEDRRRALEAKEQARIVAALSACLKHVAEGDLTVGIDDHFGLELDQMRVDMNHAITELRAAMHDVVVNATLIDGEADSINAAIDELSKRTESQAATLEETAAAMHQLTESVTSSAKRAESAAQIANDARQNADSSGGIVREAAQAMSEIEVSSQEVSKIIGVIDDIAFQTNLLALNAGVEAARAGDAGRGFAVVASEVRALAQRCLEASNEITALITASGAHVKRGVSLVGETGSALESIAASVLEISDNVGQIAQATGEQSNGLGEINTALSQLDEATQHNAAMAEETTAAAQTLANEANALSSTIGKFVIETGADGLSAGVVNAA